MSFDTASSSFTWLDKFEQLAGPSDFTRWCNTAWRILKYEKLGIQATRSRQKSLLIPKMRLDTGQAKIGKNLKAIILVQMAIVPEHQYLFDNCTDAYYAWTTPWGLKFDNQNTMTSFYHFKAVPQITKRSEDLGRDGLGRAARARAILAMIGYMVGSGLSLFCFHPPHQLN